MTVVIPVFNMNEQLAVCLGALRQQTLPVESFEVMVVDNGSDRPPVEEVEALPNARLLAESTPGSYAARNRGLKHARGTVIAFTDADCVPEATWLHNGVDAIGKDRRIGLIAGRIHLFPRYPNRPTPVECYEIVRKMRQENYARNESFGATANVFTRRDVIEKVGAFNAALKSGGDVEWGRRVKAAGFRVVYAPEVVVHHPARRTLVELYCKVARVVGGYRQRRYGEDRGAAHDSPRGVIVRRGALRDVLGDKTLSAVQKLSVLWVALFVVGVRYFESLRLTCGGRPRR